MSTTILDRLDKKEIKTIGMHVVLECVAFEFMFVIHNYIRKQCSYLLIKEWLVLLQYTYNQWFTLVHA